MLFPQVVLGLVQTALQFWSKVSARGWGSGGELETYADGAWSRRTETRTRAAAFARGSRAPATWRAYDAKWRRFTNWCDDAGEEALLAEPRTVAEFLADLADLAAVWRTPQDFETEG